MAFLQLILSTLGRFCVSAIFLLSGINKILHWRYFEDLLVTTLCDWHVYSSSHPLVTQFVDYSLSWIPLFLGAAIFFELLGAVMVFLGYRARLGAFILILFLVVETILYHPFWALADPRREVELLHVLKNGAIIGGLMIIMAYGNGFSARRRRSTDEGDIRSRQA